jgi:hypothetical protein
VAVSEVWYVRILLSGRCPSIIQDAHHKYVYNQNIPCNRGAVAAPILSHLNRRCRTHCSDIV